MTTEGEGEDPRPVRGRTLLPYVLDLARLPHRPAFTRAEPLRHDRWSRGQILAAACDLARWLEASGVRPGDRVVLQGANSPAWVVGFYATILRGAVSVPIDAAIPPAAAAEMATRVEARAGFGDAASPPLAGLPWKRLGEVTRPASVTPAITLPPPVERAPEDHVEIVFTSGTSGRPRAVPLTHANLLAGIHPIERGFAVPRRRRAVDLLRPRLLSLVPASHLFGQTVGIHLPMLMGIGVTFLDDLRPRALRDTLRREKIAAAVAVPRLLALLRDDLIREGAAPAAPAASGSFWRRAWRGRKVRRALGWRFAAWISGGGALDPEVEAFWDGLGYLIVQGYGLTETAPIISVSNPFARRRGSVGRPLSGQEIRIGDNGELWVRGDNVAAGYLDDSEATRESFQDGWLRTGDRVERDERGRLYIKGRLKDVIIGADGVNVDPVPLEKALLAQAGVREAACVGLGGPAGEEVHAVLVMEAPGGDAAAAVRGANATVAGGGRIRSWSIWGEATLPRTSLGKIKRAEVRDKAASNRAARGGAGESPAPGEAGPGAFGIVAAQLAGLSGRRPQDLTADIDLDRDLGLGSLDRVELVVRLEQALGRSLDETALAGARTLADLESAARLAPAPPLPMPRWARRLPVRAVRGVARPLLVRPAFRLYCRLERGGLEHLATLKPPFLMVANHASQLDTAAVVLALPHRLRGRLAVAMATEQFPAVFGAGIPVGRAAALGQWVGYHALVTLFHAYPLPRAGGFSATLAYTAELAEAGYCPLVFPEGRLVKAGEHVPFREGQARVAVALGLPTLPIGISGTGECMPRDSNWPRQRVTVAVHFGAPVDPGSDPAALAARLESRVRELEASARRARA